MQEVEKPRFVDVVRYIRPRDHFGEILNLFGVALVFRLDYETKTVSAGYSVCMGDNFSRVIGKDIATQRLEQSPLVFEMVNGEISKNGVVGDFLMYLESLFYFNPKFSDRQMKDFNVILNMASHT